LSWEASNTSSTIKKEENLEHKSGQKSNQSHNSFLSDQKARQE